MTRNRRLVRTYIQFYPERCTTRNFGSCSVYVVGSPYQLYTGREIFSPSSGAVEAFIAKLIEQTAPLTEFDVSNLLSHLTANAPRPTVDAVARIASAYSILLITPPEYLPRAAHMELLKRGFVADIVVYLTLRYVQNSQLSEDNLLTIREVLRRTVVHLGMVENVVCSNIADRFRVADVSCRFQKSF